MRVTDRWLRTTGYWLLARLDVGRPRDTGDGLLVGGRGIGHRHPGHHVLHRQVDLVGDLRISREAGTELREREQAGGEVAQRKLLVYRHLHLVTAHADVAHVDVVLG